MKKLICLALGLSTAGGILARAAETSGQPSAPDALAWLKRVDGELKKSSLADLTLDQLATRTEITLGGHRKTDGKHLNIPAAQFHHLAALPALRRLVLWENDGVTDAGLMHLQTCPALRTVVLNKKTGVTPEGLAEFRRRRPDCQVVLK